MWNAGGNRVHKALGKRASNDGEGRGEGRTVADSCAKGEEDCGLGGDVPKKGLETCEGKRKKGPWGRLGSGRGEGAMDWGWRTSLWWLNWLTLSVSQTTWRRCRQESNSRAADDRCPLYHDWRPGSWRPRVKKWAA